MSVGLFLLSVITLTLLQHARGDTNIGAGLAFVPAILALVGAVTSLGVLFGQDEGLLSRASFVAALTLDALAIITYLGVLLLLIGDRLEAHVP